MNNIESNVLCIYIRKHRCDPPFGHTSSNEQRLCRSYTCICIGISSVLPICKGRWLFGPIQSSLDDQSDKRRASIVTKTLPVLDVSYMKTNAIHPSPAYHRIVLALFVPYYSDICLGASCYPKLHVFIFLRGQCLMFHSPAQEALPASAFHPNTTI